MSEHTFTPVYTFYTQHCKCLRVVHLNVCVAKASEKKCCSVIGSRLFADVLRFVLQSNDGIIILRWLQPLITPKSNIFKVKWSVSCDASSTASHGVCLPFFFREEGELLLQQTNIFSTTFPFIRKGKQQRTMHKNDYSHSHQAGSDLIAFGFYALHIAALRFPYCSNAFRFRTTRCTKNR